MRFPGSRLHDPLLLSGNWATLWVWVTCGRESRVLLILVGFHMHRPPCAKAVFQGRTELGIVFCELVVVAVGKIHRAQEDRGTFQPTFRPPSVRSVHTTQNPGRKMRRDAAEET